MNVSVTKHIQTFIREQIRRGYRDVSEVTRQAFLRWMAEEERQNSTASQKEELAQFHRLLHPQGRKEPRTLPQRLKKLMRP